MYNIVQLIYSNIFYYFYLLPFDFVIRTQVEI